MTAGDRRRSGPSTHGVSPRPAGPLRGGGGGEAEHRVGDPVDNAVEDPAVRSEQPGPVEGPAPYERRVPDAAAAAALAAEPTPVRPLVSQRPLTAPRWVTNASLPSPVVGFRSVDLGTPVTPPGPARPIAPMSPMSLDAGRAAWLSAPPTPGTGSTVSAWAGAVDRASPADRRHFGRHPVDPLEPEPVDRHPEVLDRPGSGLPDWWPAQSGEWQAPALSLQPSPHLPDRHVPRPTPLADQPPVTGGSLPPGAVRADADPDAVPHIGGRSPIPRPDDVDEPRPPSHTSVDDTRDLATTRWRTRHEPPKQYDAPQRGEPISADHRHDRPVPQPADASDQQAPPVERRDVVQPLVQRRRRGRSDDGTRRPVTRRVPWAPPEPADRGLQRESPHPGAADLLALPEVASHEAADAALDGPHVTALREATAPPVSEATVPADITAAAPGGPPKAAPTRTDPDDLTAQLRRALLVERERAGALADDW